MKAIEHTYRYDQLFKLESGSALPGFQLKYTTFGNLNPNKSNVVWVCHALTGNSNFTEWWGDLFTESGPFNPNDYFIVCANTLGGCYGSTGPLSINPISGSPYYHEFPLITNHDAIQAFDLLRQYLGIHNIHTLIGGSLGGQQTLTWAVYQPSIFAHVIPIACNAKHSSWGIAINEAQRMAIQADPTWSNQSPGAGLDGLKAARAMGMITFRSHSAFSTQDEKSHDKLDNYNASSYQQYQGIKLADRFNAFSFWTLTKAMDNHNVGRQHTNVDKALNNIQAKTLIIGIDSDVLFPLAEQKFMANKIPHSQLAILNSSYGHDAFLMELKKLNRIIQSFLKRKQNLILQ